jgi:hypothetical protein
VLLSLLCDLDFSYLWNTDSVSRMLLNTVKSRLYDQNVQHWHSMLAESSKLDTYRTIKIEPCIEKYITCVHVSKYCVALARFRCSSHMLEIETGAIDILIAHTGYARCVIWGWSKINTISYLYVHCIIIFAERFCPSSIVMFHHLLNIVPPFVD